MTKQSLVICHNAVGSIQAKNSEQARALAQCLGELEAEMQVQEANNVVVMERKEAGPTEVPRRAPNKRRAAASSDSKPPETAPEN